MSRYNYTTDGEKPFLELRVEHGENPTGATYAYAIMPYADEETLEAYSKSPEVTVVSNTESIAAVRKETLGMTGYVFYAADRCEAIETDTPCIVTLVETEGTFEVSVCEPIHDCEGLKVRLHASVKSLSVGDGMSVEDFGDYTEITINCKNAKGAPFRAVFEKK